jgi:hypothetical protein
MPAPKRELEIEEDRDDDVMVERDDVDPKQPAAPPPDVDTDDGGDDVDVADDRLSHESDDDDDEPEGRRESRRRRRNRARKAAQAADRGLIDTLSQQVQVLAQELQGQRYQQIGLYVSDIDAQLAQMEGHLATIEAAAARAVKEGDDVQYSQARRLEREAAERIASLQTARQRATVAAQALKQSAAAPAPTPPQRAPSPRAVTLSREFLKDYSWFDPDDNTDEDSLVVKAIDTALTNEGYDHNSREFWDELRRRVDARGLGEGAMDDEDDDYADRKRDNPRREARRSRGALPPRSGRGGNRPANAARFALTADMREALDAEGLLDEKALSEDQKKYRDRLVKTWRDGVDAARKAGKL